MADETAPRITIKPNLKQEDNGNRLVIHCEVEASPNPDIKWYKENAHLNDSSRLRAKMTQTGTKYALMLEIDGITSDDSGSYKVVAKNRLGEVSAAIALNFAAETAQQTLADGVAPNFIQKPVIRPEADGKRICFECKIKADPQPQLFWYRDNVEIHDTGRNLIYCDNLGDGTYFACLEIDDVTMEDAGQYKLHAQNTFGESNATITLNFDSEDAGQSSGNDAGAPVFIQNPFIRQLEDKILFECKLTADPVPTFNWLFHNSPLKNSGKYRMQCLTEGKTHTMILEIDSLSSVDSGDYKLKAKNQHGETEANIKLNIETARNNKLPEGTAPHFVSKPKVTQTQDNLLIQLELIANPTPSATWFLGNKSLSELGANFLTKMERKSGDIYTLSMEIQKPKNSDAGLYKCVVINELGECIANIYLQFENEQAAVAKSDTLPPSVIEKPKIIKDEAKRMVRFEVRMRAKPQMDTVWFKNKQKLTNDKKYKIDVKQEADNVFLLSLEVSDFSPEDGGLYKVQGKNEAGQSNANIHLHVEL